MGRCNREAAREVLSIVPLVMRTVAAELRRSDRGMLPGHYYLMSNLAGRYLSLSEIADRQHVSLPTTSRSISTLVERGWVARIPDASDGRITRLTLTSEGRAVLGEIERVAAEAVSCQLAGLTPEDCVTLVRGLAVLHQAFKHPAPPMEKPSRAHARRSRSVVV